MHKEGFLSVSVPMSVSVSMSMSVSVSVSECVSVSVSAAPSCVVYEATTETSCSCLGVVRTLSSVCVPSQSHFPPSP